MRFLPKLIAGLAGLLLLTGSVSAETLRKITLAHALPQLTPSFAIDSSMPAYLGYWKQEGLEVEVVTTPGASAAIQLVVSGRADAAVASPVTAMLAIQKGVDLKLIYTTLRGDIFGVAIPEGQGLASLKDLKGHTIGVSSFASSGTNYTKSLLQKAGLQPNDFSVVEVGVGARAASALRSKQVQALGLWDEAYKQMELSGIKFGHVFTDPRADTSFAGSIVVRGKDLQEKPDLFIGLARAIAKAQLFQETNPAASVKVHWKVYPQSIPREGETPETLRNAATVASVRIPIQSRNAFGTGKYGDLPAGHVEKFQTYLVETGQLPNSIDAKRYYTNELIDKINQFDAEAIKQAAKNFKD
ncbi:MAG TPA: ABC transporter substrate-binding protein [Xanthobacteraceae bacterium]|nr:ABC transporter substrate-binding protein [Xanthobacteraceae bacterium]